MRKFESEIKHITEDNFSGSQSITLSTINATVSFVKRNKSFNQHFLIACLVSVQRQFPAFAGLFNFINAFFLFLENRNSQDNLMQFLSDYRENLLQCSQRICTDFLDSVDLTDKKVLLHSNSSMIRMLMKLAAENNTKPQVYQTISGPAEEGKVQAAFLAKNGLKVTLIHENNVARYMEKIDVVIMGADLVSETHFTNKSGSFSIGLLADHFKKPVYLIFHSDKLLNLDSLSPELKSDFSSEVHKPPGELWENAPENIRIENTYFEPIPNSMISKFHCDCGIFEARELKQHIHGRSLSKFFNSAEFSK